jgi:hypothetical protein
VNKKEEKFYHTLKKKKEPSRASFPQEEESHQQERFQAWNDQKPDKLNLHRAYACITLFNFHFPRQRPCDIADGAVEMARDLELGHLFRQSKNYEKWQTRFLP